MKRIFSALTLFLILTLIVPYQSFASEWETLGDVVGPASSTDNTIPRFNGTTGKLLQESGIFIDDSDRVGIGTTSPTQKLEIEQGHFRFNQIAAPSAPAAAVGAAGVLTGNYYYHITFVNAAGETETGTASALVAPASQQVNLSAIPIGGTGVTARKIYRTTSGGSTIQMKLVTTINDNVTTIYTDNIADGSLGVFQSRVNTTGGIGYNGTVRMFAADPAVTILGYNAGRVNTGYYNSFIGLNAGRSNTTGYYNSFMGMGAGYYNTTGYANSFMGVDAGYSNTTGYNNSFMGMNAGLSNTTGYYNSFMGYYAGYANTTGYYNSFMGVQAGRYLADGTTANQTSNNSVFLGYDTRAALAGGSNEIVIGASAIGNGSNTVTLGNTSITKTILQGNVIVSNSSVTCAATVCTDVATSYAVYLTSTGADVLTIANGVATGQEKFVSHKVDGGSVTVTPTNFSAGTSITFGEAGDTCLLHWNGTKWDLISTYGGVIN